MKRMLIVAALIASGCSKAPQDKAPVPVALVKVASVEQGAVRETVPLYGSAENDASTNAVLSAPAEAIVASVEAPAGSQVRAGQVVARLRASPTVQLDIARTSSDARAAQLALARAQRLRADGLVGNAEVESARAAAAVANSTLASLTTRRGSLVLRAPVSGFVQSIASSPGDLVAAGATVATIAKSGDLRGRFGVDPILARRVPAGATVRISPPGSGAPIGVAILSISPIVDPATRLASIYVRIPAAAGIGAGEALSGELFLSASGNALTVPYAALLDDGGQPFVYVVAGGVAHRRDIKVAPGSGDRIQVIDGIKAGEIIVTEGGTALEDGMKVRTK